MAPQPPDLDETRRRKARQMAAELEMRARILVYIAAAPGSGKTRRLLEDARRARAMGKNVAIGWIDLKSRPGLEELSRDLPRIPARSATIEGRTFEDFDLERTFELRPDVVVLDELAHENLPGSENAKRWQDALSLRDRGISVIGAFNIAHLETAAPVAEAALGFPIREIVPLAFLEAADEVIALDVSPSLLKSRLRSGKVFESADVERALGGTFSDRTLYVLRELLLRTIDTLTIPAVWAGRASTAAAFIIPGVPAEAFLRRTAAIAGALDLAIQIYYARPTSAEDAAALARTFGGEALAGDFDARHADISGVRASLIALPLSPLARRFANRVMDRDIFIAGAEQTFLATGANAQERAVRAFGGGLRDGYGKLTVFLGPAAGAGKTMAMLDRAHQLRSEGVDVVAGFIETHGREETRALTAGIETVPRKSEELDTEALVARRPAVALVDELAHTNAPGSQTRKRYEDVLALLRAGIDVLTTLNVQHLEALSDAVMRLTGTDVRETLPDEILMLADEIVLIDVTPETLRERLRAGKIYPPARAELALANFFTLENLRALRELAVREAIAAKGREPVRAPFERLLLTVAPRPSDSIFIERCARIARRLVTEFAVVCVTGLEGPHSSAGLTTLEDETRAAGGTWIGAVARNAPRKVLEIAREKPETTVAVGGATRNPRLFERGAFARRLIDAGARELLILTRPDRGRGSEPER